ncbi:MAG: hypothetical protein ABIR71_02945 [Chthoniobacterales bacterium]
MKTSQKFIVGPWSVTLQNINGTGGSVTVVDEDAEAAAERYYRVRVVP